MPDVDISDMGDVEDIHGLKDLRVPPTSSVRWTPIPPGTAACKVTVLRTGKITMPLGMLLRMQTTDKIEIPVFTFLVEVRRERIVLGGQHESG